MICRVSIVFCFHSVSSTLFRATPCVSLALPGLRLLASAWGRRRSWGHVYIKKGPAKRDGGKRPPAGRPAGRPGGPGGRARILAPKSGGFRGAIFGGPKIPLFFPSLLPRGDIFGLFLGGSKKGGFLGGISGGPRGPTKKWLFRCNFDTKFGPGFGGILAPILGPILGDFCPNFGGFSGISDPGPHILQ